MKFIYIIFLILFYLPIKGQVEYNAYEIEIFDLVKNENFIVESNFKFILNTDKLIFGSEVYLIDKKIDDENFILIKEGYFFYLSITNNNIEIKSKDGLYYINGLLNIN